MKQENFAGSDFANRDFIRRTMYMKMVQTATLTLMKNKEEKILWITQEPLIQLR